MMRVWRLSDVCLSAAYIGPTSRTERPRKTKIGTGVAHVKRDSDITFKIKTSKVNLQGRGIFWRPPAQLVTVGEMSNAELYLMRVQRCWRRFAVYDCFYSSYYYCYYAALLPRRGRILRRTLSVRPSVCPSVRPSRYRASPSVTWRHLANYNDTHVLFGSRRGPHSVRPSRPHKLVIITLFYVFIFFGPGVD